MAQLNYTNPIHVERVFGALIVFSCAIACYRSGEYESATDDIVSDSDADSDADADSDFDSNSESESDSESENDGCHEKARTIFGDTRPLGLEWSYSLFGFLDTDSITLLSEEGEVVSKVPLNDTPAMKPNKLQNDPMMAGGKDSFLISNGAYALAVKPSGEIGSLVTLPAAGKFQRAVDIEYGANSDFGLVFAELYYEKLSEDPLMMGVVLFIRLSENGTVLESPSELPTSIYMTSELHSRPNGWQLIRVEQSKRFTFMNLNDAGEVLSKESDLRSPNYGRLKSIDATREGVVLVVESRDPDNVDKSIATVFFYVSGIMNLEDSFELHRTSSTIGSPTVAWDGRRYWVAYVTNSQLHLAGFNETGTIQSRCIIDDISPQSYPAHFAASPNGTLAFAWAQYVRQEGEYETHLALIDPE